MIKIFDSRAEAQEAVEGLIGWRVKIEPLKIEGKQGYCYAIRCNGVKYLRTNGYVY